MIFITAGFFIFGVAACEQVGPAEKAGKKIDEAVEETGDKPEETGEKIEEKAEEAGERIEETGEKLEEKAESAVE